MSSNLNPEDFQKIELVGEGAFGKVYKAQNKQGQLVAIKIIDLENTQDDILDLQKEIHIQLSCNSPYIVHLYGSFIQKTELHIVMEYLSGGSIKRFLKEAPLEEDHIAVILRDMLQALTYLHKENRVHRDIKADNILIGMNGEIKLADFGVAGQLTTTMSKRNTTCGTPYWMAPEVISQSGYNQKADIWSLGITAIEMAKGVPPNHHLHPMKAMMEIGRNPKPPVLEGKFSNEFKDFVSCCLKRNPLERLTAKALLDHKFIKSAKKNAILIPLVEKKGKIGGNSKETPIPSPDTPIAQKLEDQQEFEWQFDEKSGTVKMKNSDIQYDISSGTIKTVKKKSTKPEPFDDSSVRITSDTVNFKDSDSSVRFNDSSVRIVNDDNDSSVRIRPEDDDSSVVIRNVDNDSSVIIRSEPKLEDIFDDSSVVIKKSPFDDSSVVIRQTPLDDSSVVIKPSPMTKGNLDHWDFGESDGSVIIKKDLSIKMTRNEPKNSNLVTQVVLDAIPDGACHDEIRDMFVQKDLKNPKSTEDFLSKIISKCQNSSDLSIQALVPILSVSKREIPLEAQSNPLADVLYQRWVSKGKINYL